MFRAIALVCLAAVCATADGPAPNTRKSLAAGRQVYLTHCVACHDEDGRGLNRRDFNSTAPADLTDPGEYHHGTSPEQIFASVRNGTPEDMPAFKGRVTDQQIWNMVNFVRGLWPEEKRPKLEDER